MSLDAETERLMLNWAAWRLGARTSVALSSAWALEGRGRRAEAPMPLIDSDASMVDKAVAQLPDGLRVVIEQYWVKGGRWEQKLRAARCTQRTFYRRLDDAHARIRSLLEDQRRAIERAREAYSRPLSNSGVGLDP